MNERIKELAKSAEYWANTFEDKSRYQEYLLAAFAELIVRECAEVCELAPMDYRKAFSTRIKLHFGVDE
jgi:hypothetical protein